MEYRAVPVASPFRNIYTVARLNREAKVLLEGGFPPLWVEGEISNLSRPASGHVYFCLKDGQAQVRCAWFRMQARLTKTMPADGMHVLVRARVSLYEGRGEYQLIVEYLEDAGEGALKRAFEALKNRLAQEGLFDSARKKSLPSLPRRIGVITSPSGAVLHDMLTTLKRRFPAIPILVYAVPVQGVGAATEIAAAIRLAGKRADCDVLILARGGGSLEDLWAFNEEAVARAIAVCPIPIVAGIGHETDFTIADLVADARAPTPTAAAEMVSPHQLEWLQGFNRVETRLVKIMRDSLRYRAQRLDWLGARLVHPRNRIEFLKHRLQDATRRLTLSGNALIGAAHTELAVMKGRLQNCSPLARVRSAQRECHHLYDRLQGAIKHRIESGQERIRHDMQTLHALSPLATLGRGYAIVRLPNSETIVRDAAAVAVGEPVEAKLARGSLICIVKEKRGDS